MELETQILTKIFLINLNNYPIGIGFILDIPDLSGKLMAVYYTMVVINMLNFQKLTIFWQPKDLLFLGKINSTQLIMVK